MASSAGAAAAAGGSGSGGNFSSALPFAASGGGAGGAVPVGMSVAEQGMLMTSMLKRMDRYYPLLCDQAAVIKPEYQVIASSSV
jgi:hypothetical protein